MSGIRVVRHLAAVQIDSKGDVAMGGKIGGLLLHPVIQSPPFVDHDDGRMLRR